MRCILRKTSSRTLNVLIVLFLALCCLLSVSNFRRHSASSRVVSSRLKASADANASVSILDDDDTDDGILLVDDTTHEEAEEEEEEEGEQLQPVPFSVATVLDAPLIFVGGYGRSGTTLMRAILDVHSQISCGPETKILPHVLSSLAQFRASKTLQEQVRDAYLATSTIDEAAGLFVHHVMTHHLERSHSVPRACAKDPHILQHAGYLGQLFARAKFVYMVRDGRACALSLMRRYGQSATSTRKFYGHLRAWNSYNRDVHAQCASLGPERCLLVQYEQLVQRPNETLPAVARFLNVPWQDALLHHELHVGGRVVVSDTEWSTDQIKQAVHTDALRPWVGRISYSLEYVRRNIGMLRTLGYTVDNSEEPDDGRLVLDGHPAESTNR